MPSEAAEQEDGQQHRTRRREEEQEETDETAYEDGTTSPDIASTGVERKYGMEGDSCEPREVEDQADPFHVIIRDYAYQPTDDRFRGVLPDSLPFDDENDEGHDGSDQGGYNDGGCRDEEDDEVPISRYTSQFLNLDWSSDNAGGKNANTSIRLDGGLKASSSGDWEDFTEGPEGDGKTFTGDGDGEGAIGSGAGSQSETPPTFHPEEDPSLAGAYVALYDFPPENDHELGMEEGDEVRVHYRLCEGWVVASMVRSISTGGPPAGGDSSHIGTTDQGKDGDHQVLDTLGGRRNSHELLSGIIPENYIKRLRSGPASLIHSGHWSPDVRQKRESTKGGHGSHSSSASTTGSGSESPELTKNGSDATAETILKSE